MVSPDLTARDPPPPLIRDRALGIIATATLLALLYFARDVLVPITLGHHPQPVDRAVGARAAPRRVRADAVRSGGVLMLALSFGRDRGGDRHAVDSHGGQSAEVRKTLARKLETLNNLTVKRMNAFTAQAAKALNKNTEFPQTSTLQPDAAAPKPPFPWSCTKCCHPVQVIEKVLGSIWVPIETAGIVLVVLVFVLLEQEALRDRFIRIAAARIYGLARW